jgi:hypothetical protein
MYTRQRSRALAYRGFISTSPFFFGLPLDTLRFLQGDISSPPLRDIFFRNVVQSKQSTSGFSHLFIMAAAFIVLEHDRSGLVNDLQRPLSQEDLMLGLNGFW